MEDFYFDVARNYHVSQAWSTLQEINMPKTYRKLTGDELKLYGIDITSNKIDKLREIYNKYFDKSIEPSKALIIVNSEYNDCDYDNNVTRIVFYDDHDNELVPLKIKSREFHSLNHYSFDIVHTTSQELEDQLIFLKTPSLYVEE